MQRQTDTRNDVGNQCQLALRLSIGHAVRKPAPANAFISAPTLRELKRTPQGQFVFAPQGLTRLGVPHRLSQQDDSYPKGGRQHFPFDVALRILGCAACPGQHLFNTKMHCRRLKAHPRCLVQDQLGTAQNLSPVKLVGECQLIGKTLRIPAHQQPEHTFPKQIAMLIGGIHIGGEQTAASERQRKQRSPIVFHRRRRATIGHAAERFAERPPPRAKSWAWRARIKSSPALSGVAQRRFDSSKLLGNGLTSTLSRTAGRTPIHRWRQLQQPPHRL